MRAESNAAVRGMWAATVAYEASAYFRRVPAILSVSLSEKMFMKEVMRRRTDHAGAACRSNPRDREEREFYDAKSCRYVSGKRATKSDRIVRLYEVIAGYPLRCLATGASPLPR